MVRMFGITTSERMIAGLTLVTLVCGLACSAALAEDRYIVSPSGEKTRLIQSDSEFAVVLQDAENEKQNAVSRRLASSGQGVIEDIWPDPTVRIKMIRVADVGIERRDRIGSDENILEVRPIYYMESGDTPIIPSGELIFRLTKDAAPSELSELIDAYGLVDVREAEGHYETYLAKVAGVRDELLVAEEMADEANIVWAQPNLISKIETRQTIAIDDEYYDDQWHLETIQASEAWLIAEGEDILVGMFDDSCDIYHEDLRDNYIGTGQDASLPSNASGYDDPRPKQFGDRHGTAVMGLVVAGANNVGVRGVAHRSRYTASRGLSQPLTDFEIASVFTFARQQSVDVHVNSWGLPRTNPQVVVDAIQTAYNEGRELSEGADPLGMVILFATGNDGIENTIGSDLSSLPYVIGVGASASDDSRASYSNYGSFINILAPSGDTGKRQITTTDNSDDFAYADDGYNAAGFDDFGGPNLDTAGRYTEDFSGTSAACPIAAGVASLLLSANPLLSATDVRLIMEHTAEQVDLAAASYNGVTSRSFTHGYGRINALQAVEAAVDALTNGGFTWPERVSSLAIESDSIKFAQSHGANGFLIVESENEFSFIPQDGVCYDSSQAGCGSAVIGDLPSGVSVLFTGCETDMEGCNDGSRHTVEYTPPISRKFFGIFARNNVGRYSFGVAVDSDGNIFDANPVGGSTGGDVDPGNQDGDRVDVTITATPLKGQAPLKVEFTGNAISDQSIDSSKTKWVFNSNDDVENVDGSLIIADETDRHTSHTYTAPGNYTAKLYMEDVEGNQGAATVIIIVDPADGTDPTTDPDGSDDVTILVGRPGTVGSDEDTGTAPFSVQLSVDATSLSGTLQSVEWDLGDGTSASSLSVPHTFENETDTDRRYVVTATITVETTGNKVKTIVASRVITVAPETGDATPDPGAQPGTGAQGGVANTVCGSFGMLMPFVALFSFVMFRRRFA